MKILDEKGRLFGKLNLIDLLVVLLIVAVIFVAAWKLGGSRAAEAVTSEHYTVEYTVLFEDVPLDVCGFARGQIDAQLTNSGKLVDAHITAVTTAPGADEAHQTLYVTIAGDADFSGYVYKVGAQEVRVGYEYIVKTSELELTGIISAMEVTHD